MPIFWPQIYSEEVVEYMPESLLGTAGLTTLATLLSKSGRSNRLFRSFKIATYAFTGLFLSQTIEHYSYKFFVHNPLPTETKNPLWHALIGSAAGNVVMGLCVSRILVNMGFEQVPTVRVTLLIMAVYMAAIYGDYLYDHDFYDKKFYRVIVRDGRELDKETAAKMRYEQSRMENIGMQKMEQMIRMHHGAVPAQEGAGKVSSAEITTKEKDRL